MTSSKKILAALLAFPPVFLAVSHLWGTVYYETWLRNLGFDASDFPLTTPQVYVHAFRAALTVVFKPFAWLTQVPFVYLVSTLLVAAVLALLLGWLRSQVRLVRWWRRFSRRTAGRQRARRLPRLIRYTVEMFITLVSVMLSPFILSWLLTFTWLVIAGPPVWAGQAEASAFWERKEYLNWRQVSWQDEKTGIAQTGALMRCTDKLCGVVQEGRSLLIAPAQIHYLPREIPVAASSKAGVITASDAPGAAPTSSAAP